ncbi:MAG: hypothetical protein DSM106950_21330 [Stigonema ocellatum SAG 48.90 = DSM 106950]|nr:hypothetical protein [Stigonema ocellatum SAG 48.90 = DSM 106950]
MSTYESNPQYNACEFTVRIKLNIPIEVNPQVLVTPPSVTEQKIPIYLEPDIYLRPEVSATPPVCLPQSSHNRQNWQAVEVQPSAEAR